MCAFFFCFSTIILYVSAQNVTKPLLYTRSHVKTVYIKCFWQVVLLQHSHDFLAENKGRRENEMERKRKLYLVSAEEVCHTFPHLLHSNTYGSSWVWSNFVSSLESSLISQTVVWCDDLVELPTFCVFDTALHKGFCFTVKYSVCSDEQNAHFSVLKSLNALTFLWHAISLCQADLLHPTTTSIDVAQRWQVT